jgi:hypothetical protein
MLIIPVSAVTIRLVSLTVWNPRGGLVLEHCLHCSSLIGLKAQSRTVMMLFILYLHISHFHLTISTLKCQHLLQVSLPESIVKDKYASYFWSFSTVLEPLCGAQNHKYLFLQIIFIFLSSYLKLKFHFLKYE